MIIGLTGTFSSGKDMLAEHLQEKYGIMHISTGDIVREIAKDQKGSIERPVLLETANELRHTYGGGVLVERALDRYHNSIRTYAGVVITGIRTLAEAQVIKDKGGTIIYVDAPLEIRYKRMQDRARDGEARISLEAFEEREKHEMSGTQTDTDAHILSVKDVTDINLQNSGTVDEFFDTAEKALAFK
jgi:dephospho-CoA kinase